MTPDPARRARFEELAAEVWEPVARYLARRTPEHEDVLAEVLLVLWRRLDDVPPEAVLPWAYGVARGCLANARRSEERRLRLVRRLAAEPVVDVDPNGDPELAEALASLSATDSEVLRLWAWEGLEAREVAVVLGISGNAAALRLSRARAALRERLRPTRQDGRGPGHRQEREEAR